MRKTIAGLENEINGLMGEIENVIRLNQKANDHISKLERINKEMAERIEEITCYKDCAQQALMSAITELREHTIWKTGG